MSDTDRSATTDESSARTAHLRVAAEAALAGLDENLVINNPISVDDYRRKLHELNVYRIELELQNEELRRAQAALEESRDRYAELYDFAPVGYLTLSDKGCVSAVNLACAKLLGIDRSALLDMPLGIFINEPDILTFTRHLASTLATDTRHVCEIAMKRNDGTPFFSRLESVAVATGGPGRYLRTAVIDITERKNAQARIDELVERKALATEAAGVGIWELDLITGALTFNSVLAGLYGINVSNGDFRWTYEEWLTRIHPDDAKKVLNGLGDAFTNGTSFTTDLRILWPDGATKTLKTHAKVHRDNSGQPMRVLGASWDITDHCQTIENLTLSLKTNRAILETAVNPIIVTDSRGIIQSFNPAATKLFGYAQDEAIGRNVNMLMPEPVRSLHDWYLDRLRDSADSIVGGYGREVVGLRKDGSTIPVHLSLGTMATTSERMFVAVVTDLTERRYVEAELRKARARAEVAAQSMSAFLANMSHEIRTPMNGIIGFAEILSQDRGLSERAAGHVRVIHGASIALLTIINDILDLSKLESGQFEMEAVSFNLPETLKEAMRLLENTAATKNLGFTLECASNLPVVVTGDPMRLRQVVVNLVSNAVKFTKAGSVTVSAQVAEQSDMIWFSVADTGIGMSADQMARVFEPFTQADASTSRRFGGTGLGTTIAKQIVRLMDGDIGVESELGRGSVFHFTARLPEASVGERHAAGAGDNVGERYVSPRMFRVLMAEDVESNAAPMMLRLTDQGHKVDWVKSGIDCVSAFRQGEHDLILMDVLMPGLDGIETAREIRRLERLGERPMPRIPIVALTASAMRDCGDRCLSAGMDAFLRKPVDFNSLLAAMERIVPEGPAHHDLQTSELDRRSKHELKPFDRKVVVSLLGDIPGALEQLTPDAVEPILARLADYLPVTELSSMRKCLDDFDFDAANLELEVLSASLGVKWEHLSC